MKLNYLYLALVLGSVTIFAEQTHAIQQDSEEEQYDVSIPIKVLINQIDLSECPEIDLGATEKNKLTAVIAGKQHKNIEFEGPVALQYSANGFKINRKKFSLEPICFESSGPDGIIYNKRRYMGKIQLLPYKDSLLVINQLPMEEYIYSVIKTESWPGWPVEYNKVQAIISRTYALDQILRNKRAKLPYHIRATNINQTYSGAHHTESIRQAVQETEHVFLIYNNQPITAMYDSCCGGVIPAKIAGVNFDQAPYLKRTKPCNYCTACRYYRWEFTTDKGHLEHALRELIPGLRTLRKITIKNNDKAGLVQQLTVHGHRHQTVISAAEFYRVFKPVKSRAFTISNNMDSITFKGKGLGHQLGVCQWGAKGMIDKGYTYKEVLDFYYPGTKLMRLKQIVYRPYTG